MEIALPLRGGIEMVGKANAAVVEYKYFLKLFGYVYLRSLRAHNQEFTKKKARRVSTRTSNKEKQSD